MAFKEKSRLPFISAVILMATGVFWAYVVASQQGDLLLVWPALASLVSGGLILSRRSMDVARRVSMASALYSLIIFGYQAYSAVGLLGSGFASYASIALAGYLAGALILLFLILALYADSAAFAPSTTRPVEDNTSSTARR